MESAYVPAAQSAQTTYPEDGAEVPFGQSTHEDIPSTSLNLPAWHGMQTPSRIAAMEEDALPPPQAMQTLDPGDGL